MGLVTTTSRAFTHTVNFFLYHKRAFACRKLRTSKQLLLSVNTTRPQSNNQQQQQTMDVVYLFRFFPRQTIQWFEPAAVGAFRFSVSLDLTRGTRTRCWQTSPILVVVVALRKKQKNIVLAKTTFFGAVRSWRPIMWYVCVWVENCG